jgi:HECT-domain (ubiquitin-transferase)
MFNDRELQQLISGAQKGLDIADLRANVVLGGGYHTEHPTVAMLWRVLEGLDAKEQAAFLKFVTGCSRCVHAQAGHVQRLESSVCVSVTHWRL